jgi:large subunit ribosomal protein L18
MRLSFRKKSSNKLISRLKKKVRVRKKVFGTEERPRLVVFRSAKHIYAQLINDDAGLTVVSASTTDTKIDGSKSSKGAATAIGQSIAKKAQSKNIKTVVFDRGGFRYHGRVKALADAAREAGLNF